MVKMADLIMQHRQKQNSIINVLEICGDDELCSELTKIAYTTPAYQSEKYQRRAINEFKNEVGVLCINSK
jgi:hypothetical protein